MKYESRKESPYKPCMICLKHKAFADVFCQKCMRECPPFDGMHIIVEYRSEPGAMPHTRKVFVVRMKSDVSSPNAKD